MVHELTPEQVFTPRSPQVNPEMYVSRDALEVALLNGLDGAKHLILHGESGSGKSWLYKRVFAEHLIVHEIVNLADASRFGSIAAALKHAVDRQRGATQTGYAESKSTGINAVLAKGDMGHTATYELPRRDPFDQCLQTLRERAKAQKAVLVLDNLESIFGDEARIKELADLITLVDDESYAKYMVKFLIVGVPSGLQRYFYSTPNMRTVGNRVTELQEVFRFDEKQTYAFVRRGFVDRLRYIDAEDSLLRDISSHILWVTGGIPQRLHEYCLLLANSGLASGGRITIEHLKQSDSSWLQESGYQAYSVVEAAMNEKATRAQRRNQVLYAMGQLKSAAFRAAEIENLLRKIFPKSTDEVALNVAQIVADLSTRENSVVRRSPKGDTYVFSDPVYRMALRTMLSVDENEQVQKKEIESLFGSHSN